LEKVDKHIDMMLYRKPEVLLSKQARSEGQLLLEVVEVEEILKNTLNY